MQLRGVCLRRIKKLHQTRGGNKVTKGRKLWKNTELQFSLAFIFSLAAAASAFQINLPSPRSLSSESVRLLSLLHSSARRFKEIIIPSR